MDVVSAAIAFTVTHLFVQAPHVVWDELVDWKGHESWIPMTRIQLGPEPQNEVGATLMAFTGIWKLGLEDNMRVKELTWDDEAGLGRCEVEKLGPILTGVAGFIVEPYDAGTKVEWMEDVTAKYVPSFVRTIAARAGEFGFGQAMKRMEKILNARRSEVFNLQEG